MAYHHIIIVLIIALCYSSYLIVFLNMQSCPWHGVIAFLPSLSLLFLGILRNAVLNYYIPRPFITSVYLIVLYKLLVQPFLGKKKKKFLLSFSNLFLPFLSFVFPLPCITFSYFLFPSCWLSWFFNFSFKNHFSYAHPNRYNSPLLSMATHILFLTLSVLMCISPTVTIGLGVVK